MVNTEEFTKRLNRIMEYYDLSAASFADKIEVGRSSISHLLSGRNNPSLDFVMKIINAFPEVELYWLLNGKGEFPRSTSKQPVNSPPPLPAQKRQEHPRDLFSEEEHQQSTGGVKRTQGKEIDRIVIFYTDGSFDAFEN